MKVETECYERTGRDQALDSSPGTDDGQERVVSRSTLGIPVAQDPEDTEDPSGHIDRSSSRMNGLSNGKVWPSIGWCLLASLATGCTSNATSATTREASGIVRRGSELLLVVDPDPGAYYTIAVPASGRALSLRPSEVTRVAWPAARLALDLESIEVLADGRVVLLSERLHALVGRCGIVADYDEPLISVGKRGLEGLAVRPLAGGASEVAVLWEGGYPSEPNLPQPLEGLAAVALPPYVLIHRLERGERGVLVKLGEKPGDPDRRIGKLVKLDVPKPPGNEPLAHRFRAPDLVWHRTTDGDWGFIVLLSSHNSPAKGKREKFKYLELRRFSVEGKDLRESMDLKALLPETLREVNWEGLDWFVEGKSLVLVHEAPAGGPAPSAYILELRKEWRWES